MEVVNKEQIFKTSVMTSKKYTTVHDIRITWTRKSWNMLM